jgi:hypothetical protein
MPSVAEIEDKKKIFSRFRFLHFSTIPSMLYLRKANFFSRKKFLQKAQQNLIERDRLDEQCKSENILNLFYLILYLFFCFLHIIKDKTTKNLEICK